MSITSSWIDEEIDRELYRNVRSLLRIDSTCDSLSAIHPVAVLSSSVARDVASRVSDRTHDTPFQLIRHDCFCTQSKVQVESFVLTFIVWFLVLEIMAALCLDSARPSIAGTSPLPSLAE